MHTCSIPPARYVEGGVRADIAVRRRQSAVRGPGAGLTCRSGWFRHSQGHSPDAGPIAPASGPWSLAERAGPGGRCHPAFYPPFGYILAVRAAIDTVEAVSSGAGRPELNRRFRSQEAQPVPTASPEATGRKQPPTFRIGRRNAPARPHGSSRGRCRRSCGAFSPRVRNAHPHKPGVPQSGEFMAQAATATPARAKILPRCSRSRSPQAVCRKAPSSRASSSPSKRTWRSSTSA